MTDQQQQISVPRHTDTPLLAQADGFKKGELRRRLQIERPDIYTPFALSGGFTVQFAEDTHERINACIEQAEAWLREEQDEPTMQMDEAAQRFYDAVVELTTTEFALDWAKNAIRYLSRLWLDLIDETPELESKTSVQDMIAFANYLIECPVEEYYGLFSHLR